MITVYADRSFTFVTKTPPAAVFAVAAGIAKGSPQRGQSGEGGREQLEEIAKMKMPDLTADMDAAIRTIAGGCSSGIDVEGYVAPLVNACARSPRRLMRKKPMDRRGGNV